MICGECSMCVVEKESFEIETWKEGDKEKPFCLMQDLYTNVDPKKDCCNSDVKRYAIEKKEGKYE